MPTINNFIYCQKAERSLDGDNQVVTAVNIFMTLTPPFIPGAFSFSILFSINGIDLTKNVVVRIEFLDPDGKELANTGDIQFPPAPKMEGPELPDEVKGLMMSLDLQNIVFEKEGYYESVVYCDGQKLPGQKIYVKGGH